MPGGTRRLRRSTSCRKSTTPSISCFATKTSNATCFARAVPAASTRTRPSRACGTLATLKAKLIRLEEEKREAEFAKKYDEKGEVSFGNQIRSYVLQPYQIVKDLRTDHEVGNPRAVLDGNIDGFIEAYLRMKLAKGGMDLAKK
jgi:protein subunit release factor B